MYRRPGLGQTTAEVTSGLNFAAQTALLIPGAGPIIAGVLELGSAVASMFHIGAGRREADVIVPNQNALMSYLGQTTDLILVGKPTPSIYQLQVGFQNMITATQQFINFVQSPQFTDRRASGQALNSVMPYIDGSCGYPVPLPPPGQRFQPTQFNCVHWGDGTIGGVGTNGMLGAVQRAIVHLGGTLQPPAMVQNAIPGLAPPGSVNIPQPGLAPPLPPPGTVYGTPAPALAPLAGLEQIFSDPITLALIAAAVLLWPK